MKKAIFNVILIVALTSSILLFQSCPIGRGDKIEPSIFQRPIWAVNKPGNILIEFVDLDPVIEYNPTEGFENEYSLICRSLIYTGEERKSYRVSYTILSSVVPEIHGPYSFNMEEAEFDLVKDNIFPFEKEIGKYKLRIPKNFEALSNINVIINYNISGMLTKIKIPMTVRRPAAGTASSIEVPVYYTASLIVPKSNKIKVDITSRGVSFYLDIIDAGGCFSGYRKPPQLRLGENFVIRVSAAGKELKNVSCTPSTINNLPATLRCSISLIGDEEILKLFRSEAGVYIEVDIRISYDCSMSQLYNIKVSKQV